MKRASSILIVFCLLFMLSLPASATPSEPDSDYYDFSALYADGILVKSVSINEYDAFVQLQNSSSSALQSRGYSNQEIKILRETSYEDLLLERATMTTEELAALGYDSKAIAILHAYDGTPLSENPEVRSILATFTGDISVVQKSYSMITTKLEWSWSSQPLVTGLLITDIVGCGFQGTNTANLPCTVELRDAGTYNIVYYYTNTSDYLGLTMPEIDDNDPTASVTSTVPTKDTVNYNIGWAKEGIFVVSIQEYSPNNDLYGAVFAYGFGHVSVDIDATASLDFIHREGSIDFDFGLTTTEEFAETVRVKN